MSDDKEEKWFFRTMGYSMLIISVSIVLLFANEVLKTWVLK